MAAKQAFDENITSYMHPLNGCPQLFWYNAILIASNGTDTLTVFDLLTRPGPDLSPDERDALVLNWREKAQARAQVRLAIEDALDEGLPGVYTPDAYQQKRGVLFEHVFESFGDFVQRPSL